MKKKSWKDNSINTLLKPSTFILVLTCWYRSAVYEEDSSFLPQDPHPTPGHALCIRLRAAPPRGPAAALSAPGTAPSFPCRPKKSDKYQVPMAWTRPISLTGNSGILKQKHQFGGEGKKKPKQNQKSLDESQHTLPRKHRGLIFAHAQKIL